jgi:hypothetical protein
MQFVDGEREIPTGERLVANLLIGGWVSAPMSSVENDIAVILCILVSPSENHGVGSFVPTPRDACHAWTVNAST